MACTRECAVCYADVSSFRKLACGHEFCSDCIKTWYLKGAGEGCPMCRRPIYFKGFHKVREQWNEDAWHTRCNEVFSQFLDEVTEEACEVAQFFSKRTRSFIMGRLLDELKDADRTFRALKFEGFAADEVEYILFETSSYCSDRHLGKYTWADEPVKKFVTKYPRPLRAPRRSAGRPV